MLLPKSFLGSPSDQHLCFLWIIIHKKQHRPNNKNTSAGNPVNSLCLASSNAPALTQTPNGSSQPTTPRQEAWCCTPQPAMTGLTHKACRLTISMVNLHGRKQFNQNLKRSKKLAGLWSQWYASLLSHHVLEIRLSVVSLLWMTFLPPAL